MDLSIIKVISTFNTSVGFIAILRFPKPKMPCIGMKLKDEYENHWIVKGIGMQDKIQTSSEFEKYPNNDELWNCRLVNEENPNKHELKGNLLFFSS